MVLGIDPGSKVTGYGLVAKNGTQLTLVAAGQISTKASSSLPCRLHQVFEGLTKVVAEFGPDVVAVEDVFYAKNVRSAIRLGHVRGVALLVAAMAGLPVFEYPPASIKSAVVGYGRAEKGQVGMMVGHILKIKASLPEDAADAVATAICHHNHSALAKL
ncbi:MAG: crossover junction endodeoxyribonuclease RuvC [Deltaproteobacteria bacterium]|nr:crossover junction endodeoxyribonuclease RuvC [Deltaproteobacteria bacterium]